MSDSPFKQPGTGGDKFDLRNNGQEWLGALMLVWPLSVKENFDTGQYDPTDVVEADIALIDRMDPETGKPLFFERAFIFSKGLVNNTRNDVGGMVLGRLVRRQFANGTGWSMDPFSDADAQLAQQYIMANPRNVPAQPSSGAQSPPPAAAQAPPANDPWSLPPAPQAAAPAPAPASSAGAANVNAFLQSKGVTPPPDENAALMIAKSFPDFPG